MKFHSILWIVILIGFPAFAKPLTTMDLMVSSKPKLSPNRDNLVEDRREVDFSKRRDVAVQKRMGLFDTSDVAFVIPTNMRTTSNGIDVEKRILSHWGRNLGRASYMRDNKIIRTLKRTAKQLERATDVSIKKKATSTAKPSKVKSPVDLVQTPQKISHGLKLKVQALKQEARIIYSGFFDSTLTYKQKSNSLIFQAHRSLTKNSHLGVSSKSEPSGEVHLLNYGYSW